MTAIAIAQLPSGFVIAADGRMRIDAETRLKASAEELTRETEIAQKILEISDKDKAIACAITGTIANDDFSFNLVDEARDQARLLAGREFDLSTWYINRFCSNLSRKIAKAKQFEKIYATLIFAGYFKTSPIFMAVKFYPSKNTSLFEPANYSRFLISGSETVARAMYEPNGRPKNSVFNAYAKYLDDNATLGDAEHFAKGYIDACCSDLAQAIAQDECGIIGGHVHVAEITPPGRFRWRIAPINLKR